MVERQSNHHSDFQFKSRLVSFEMMDNELVGLVNFWVQDLRRTKCSACTDNLLACKNSISFSNACESIGPAPHLLLCSFSK